MSPKLAFALAALAVLVAPAVADGLVVRSFQPRQPLCRALRPAVLVASVANDGPAMAEAQLALVLPEGVKFIKGTATQTVPVAAGEEKEVAWEVLTAKEGSADLTLQCGAQTLPLTIRFLPPLEQRKLSYLPEPTPAATQILVGAHHCPLWEADKPRMWDQVVNKHLERTPALGFYDQANPEVSDWETKWAVEHGVSFFLYCWYRSSQGGPVTTRFSSAIEQALFNSRYQDKLKFSIMWENQSRGTAGVAGEQDLMDNLLPYWINNYFKRANYLKIDNKPVLFIYRPEFLIQDLGGADKVPVAFDKMRQACRDAGFDGLYLIGEYRGLDPKHLTLMKQLGLDYTFAYCWGIPGSPAPQQAIDTQMSNLRKTQELGIIPQIATVSQAWSGWRDEGSIWKIPPDDFQRLLQQAKDLIATFPAAELGSKMLLLDNWNEWGEGHYIAPYREYGFGYLDAVRNVFAPGAGPHTDLLPEDIGMGPYDTAIRSEMAREKELNRLCTERVTRPGGDAPGLVAWWSFDEAQDVPVALDYSGHGLGAALKDAARAPGLIGQALVCDGGAATVAPSPALSVTQAMTVECWVRTDLGGQSNKWFVNRVRSGGVDAGFRLGMSGGAPCFGVPVTSFSHHLTATKPLPTGRWVHLAGAFDGQTIRLYMDGEECGTMPRPGPMKPSNQPLTLGSYEAGHQAYFTGLLDEVKVWDRAFTGEEIKGHCDAQGAR